MTVMQAQTTAAFWAWRPLAGTVLLAAGVVLTGWLMYLPEGLLGKADAIGYAVCHRIDLRSFHLGDRAISLCARCTGMYLGAVLGLAYLAMRSPRAGGSSPRRVLAAMGVLALVFVLDGLNSFANLLPGFPSLYTTTNAVRVFAGTGFGIVMAFFVYPAFNQTVWAGWTPVPAVRDLRDLARLLGLGVLTALLVLSENPLLLYPAALVSAGGVLLLLTMVYAMMAMILLRRENFAARWHQLIVPLALGFTVAILQIATSDLLRYLLTGTWEGFHIG